MSGLSSEPFAQVASDLAALVDDALAEGAVDTLDNEALGQAMAAVVRLYVAKAESGAKLMPFGRNAAITPTEISTAALAMLDAGRMEVFELGLWEQWTHIRPARATSLADLPTDERMQA